MGFGGSAAAMIQSLRNNKKQLRKREKYFEKDANPISHSYGKLEDHKKMTLYEFKAFQKKLQQEESRRMTRLILAFTSIMIIILVSVIYLLYF
jgi:Na+/phosphate symporter